jgi:nucleoside-diphosphate-sugar epimerase
MESEGRRQIVKKRILVTGGCGYIGAKLTSHMLDPLVQVADVKVYGQGGLANYGDFISVPDLHSFDVVIHLAATTNGIDCGEDQDGCINNNVNKTLKFARECKPDVRFIFASSSAVYGDQGGNVGEPRSCNSRSMYGLTKYFCERGLSLILNNLVCVRLGTVWGVSPFMRPHLMVHDMVRSAIEDGCIEVFHGSTRRPFIHVSDAAMILAALIKTDTTGVIDIGTEVVNKYTLADFIRKETGCKIEVGKSPLDIQDFSIHRKYPGTELRYGIKELIHYYETQPDYTDAVAH